MCALILVQDFFSLLYIQEKPLNVISHCPQAFYTKGLPKVIKMDNGPVYTGNNFISFWKEFGCKHKTGITYNPTGQGIVERAHHTLKNWLLKTSENYTLLDHPKHTLLLFCLF